MIEIQPKRLRAYPWLLRPLFWMHRRKYGEALDSALIWARSPRLFLGVAVLVMIDRLRSHLSDDAIVELTGLIAFENLSGKFNRALGVPAQGFCDLPKENGSRS